MTDDKQWYVLKKYPQYEMYLEWESYLKKKDHQTIDLDDEDVDQRESTGGSSGTKRYCLVEDSVSSPKCSMGRDKAKRMGKSSTSNSVTDEVCQEWSEFNVSYPQQLQLKREKFEHKKASEAERMAVKKNKLKNQMRIQLLSLVARRPNLSRIEEALVDQLTEELGLDI